MGNINQLLIIRGPSGAGKTTLVESLIRKSPKGVYNYHLSADFYMHEGYPEKPIAECPYVFKPEQLKENHRRVFQEFIEVVAYTLLDKSKVASIYLDNTNLQWWEFELYARVAKKLNYEVKQLIPEIKASPEEMAKRNKHGVPWSKIEEMIGKFESYESIQKKLDNL
jgi:predicted kinase